MKPLLLRDFIFLCIFKGNPPLVKKLISRFKGTIKKSATVDSESIKYLKKLVSKFEKALDNAQGGVKISQIGGDDEEKEEKAAGSQQSADSKVDERYSFVKQLPDGRKVYKSNYPENTPKIEKQKDIIDIIQSAWSKEPIELTIVENGNNKKIIAQFNPDLQERSDLAKIAYGNKKGTGSEKRITLNLSTDFYQIAKDAKYVRSKSETGKEIKTHDDVKEWHYFVTNLVYEEESGQQYDCYMNIDVKENGFGNWFYSFAIEKGVAPQTLLAVVTEKSATTPTNIIPENGEKNNTFDENNSKKVSDERKSVKRSYEPGEESSKKYSYDEVVNKNDLTVIDLSDTVPLKSDGSIDRGIIINEARKNAKSKNNPNNTDKETFVYVPDIAKNVRINRAGLEHGLSHGAEDTAIATMNIGDLLESSFAINELNGRTTNKKQTEMSYVLFAVGRNKKGSYLVRIKIDKDMNAISEISACGLAAIRAKENGALFMLNSNEGVGNKTPVPYLGSTISIADLLYNVKNLNLANEVFSDDVAKELGVTKSKGDLSNDLRYSKTRSYNPLSDVDDEGNKWVESEDENGIKILFSMPDFDNPAYEYNHIPDEEPEIVETYKAVASSSVESDLRKRLADLTKAKVYARNEVESTGKESEFEKDTTLFFWLATEYKRSQYCKN